jgi:hypothetical protein
VANAKRVDTTGRGRSFIMNKEQIEKLFDMCNLDDTPEVEMSIKELNGFANLVIDYCAEVAKTAGLGEPHTLPPYNVREKITQEILARKDTW